MVIPECMCKMCIWVGGCLPNGWLHFKFCLTLLFVTCLKLVMLPFCLSLFRFSNDCFVFEQEKNRINKDGEIVISSTKTRTQKLASAPFLSAFYLAYLLQKQIIWLYPSPAGVTSKMLWGNYRYLITVMIICCHFSHELN